MPLAPKRSTTRRRNSLWWAWIAYAWHINRAFQNMFHSQTGKDLLSFLPPFFSVGECSGGNDPTILAIWTSLNRLCTLDFIRLKKAGDQFMTHPWQLLFPRPRNWRRCQRRRVGLTKWMQCEAKTHHPAGHRGWQGCACSPAQFAGSFPSGMERHPGRGRNGKWEMRDSYAELIEKNQEYQKKMFLAVLGFSSVGSSSGGRILKLG